MPTFSLVEIAKVAFKIALIAILTSLLVGFVASFTDIILGLLNKIVSSFAPLNNLDIGYFAKEIGLVDFLNALMNSLFIAGNIFVSALIAILTFKFGFKAYSALKSI